MHQRHFSVFIAAALAVAVACAQAPAANTNIPVRIGVQLVQEKGVFYNDEALSATIHLNNTSQQKIDGVLVTEIKTDAGAPVTVLKTPLSLPKAGLTKQAFSHKVSQPGFYRVTAHLEWDNKSGPTTAFNLGYEPEKIVCAPSAKPDFKSFWEKGLAELSKVEPHYSLVLLTNLCTDVQNLYEVRMHSFGDVVVGGHYLVPKKPGKYPTVVRFLGYSSGPAIPQRDDQPVIRYVASTRGQGVMKPENSYGEWMAYRLDSRDDYYFRGAYLDTVRAIDFVCTRPEVDQSRIAVEGGSQGGTLSYVCAALDKRVAFCMPTIPGFCDIPTFIELTPWPGGIYRHYLATNDKGVTQEAMYAMLTYYDVKNFAAWITCPVYMGVGLQDTICPPRTNFAPYNLLKAEKRFLIYPETGHGVRGSDYHPKAYKWMIEKLSI
jgi:cephalosporin-C deacetylase-like acetyl esterase